MVVVVETDVRGRYYRASFDFVNNDDIDIDDDVCHSNYALISITNHARSSSYSRHRHALFYTVTFVSAYMHQ